MTAGFDERRRTEQRFADALCGPDGTGDPSVLMPVLEVYPDALSAPMPDATVGMAAFIRAAAPVPAAVPAQASRTVPSARVVAQPGRYGRNQAPGRTAERSPRPAPSTRGRPEQNSAAPRMPTAHPPAPSTASTGSAWSGQLMSPGEVAGFLRNTVHGITHGGSKSPAHHQPALTAPTPPLPRRTPSARRNKGSGVWAVLVFLVVIAFASGLAQQLIRAISELLNP